MKSTTSSEQFMLKSIRITPTWQEIQNLDKHVDNYARFFTVSKNLKSKKLVLQLPQSIAQQYIDDAFEKDASNDCRKRASKQWKQKTSALVALLWRSDIHVENAKEMICSLRQCLVQIALTNGNQSVKELRNGCFKVLHFLPEDEKKEFQQGWLQEAVKQLLALEASAPPNGDNANKHHLKSTGHMFALMVLDEHIRIEELMRRSLDLYSDGQVEVAKKLVEVLYNSPYNWIFQHQCQKQLADEFRVVSRIIGSPQRYNKWDPEITEINAVTNVKRLFEVLYRHQSSLNEEALALAAFKMSKFNTKCEYSQWVFDLLQKKFVEIHEHFNNAGWLQQFVRSFGLCKVPFKANTCNAVLDQISKNTQKFNAGQCQSILHKFVFLNIRTPSIIKGLVEQLCAQIEGSDIEALSKTVWTLGILGGRIDDGDSKKFTKEVVKRIEQGKKFTKEVVKRIEQVGCMELTQLLIGMSKMHWRPVNVLSCLKMRILTVVSEGAGFSALNTIKILSSFILLNYLIPDLLFVLKCFLNDLSNLSLSTWDVALVLLAYNQSFVHTSQKRIVWVQQQFQDIVVKIVNVSPTKMIKDLKGLFQAKRYGLYVLNPNEALDCLYVLLKLSIEENLKGSHKKDLIEMYHIILSNEHKLRSHNRLQQVQSYIDTLNDGSKS